MQIITLIKKFNNINLLLIKNNNLYYTHVYAIIYTIIYMYTYIYNYIFTYRIDKLYSG
jgi:hypothetical protein